jgi:hypothetical protein
MDSFAGFRKSGTFIVPPGIEVQGDLVLNGGKTTLDLFSNVFFNTRAIMDGCITGALHDRTKVSLIECITTQGPGSGNRGGEIYHFGSVFPHFVIFGNEHITSSDRKIMRVSFQVDDAATLFYDFDAFGQVIDARQHIAGLVHTKEKVGRDIPVGNDPMIFYFAGKYEIFAAETILGTVSASHRPSYSMPGPRGINVNNRIDLDIAFKEGATVREAIIAVHTLLRFLEIIAGRPQTVLKLAFCLPGVGDRPTILDAYWSMSPLREGEEGDRKPHPGDLPIQAAQTPDVFAAVLTNWLARDHDWRDARHRFSTAFAHQHRFTIDRIVGAANMFDILPSSAVPADVLLPRELEAAKNTSKLIFKTLPKTIERDSVLNSLGRIGQATLKNKVRARAKLIRDRIPSRFPELELVLEQAIDCRNYFVHGSKRKLDYSAEFDQVIFFTEALEFVFAASDLVECGWSIEDWAKQSSSISHPIDNFRLNYQSRLTELKRALADAKANAESPSL